MHEPLTGLMLPKEQYESLASRDAHREPLFPSWIEWNKLQMRAVGAAVKHGGRAPPPWTIDIDAFHAWCARMGATPCIDELRHYSLTPGARRRR
jgi:hypothetical protein